MRASYTVVVCAHNEEKYIEKALKSIFNQTIKPEKVIVVLDRCTDRTGEIARLFPVEVLEKKEAKWSNSYSENLELARKHVDTEFYAIVDADVVLEPDYFEKLLSAVDEKTGCIGGEVLTRSDTLLGKLLAVWEKTYKLSPFRRPRGCALLIRRELLDKVGGFADVPAPDTYIQDQALKHGYRVRILPKAKAYHVRSITLEKAVRTQLSAGRARYIQGKSFLRTLAHSIVRARPFVVIGYIKAFIDSKRKRK